MINNTNSFFKWHHCQLFEMKINVRPLIFPCSVVDWGEGLECTRAGFAPVRRGGRGIQLLCWLCLSEISKVKRKSYFTTFPVDFEGGEEGKDACTGDGGGPLVCPGPDGRFPRVSLHLCCQSRPFYPVEEIIFRMELVGLVSWGLGCGEEGLPGNQPEFLITFLITFGPNLRHVHTL